MFFFCQKEEDLLPLFHNMLEGLTLAFQICIVISDLCVHVMAMNVEFFKKSFILKDCYETVFLIIL